MTMNADLLARLQLAAALLHAAVMSSIAYRVLSLASSPVDTAWSRNHQGTLFQAALLPGGGSWRWSRSWT